MADAGLLWDGAEWSIGQDGNAQLRYSVLFDPDTEDEADIEAAALAVVPASYAGYSFSSLALRPNGWNTYLATARYTQRPRPDTSGATPPDFAFEITSQQVKIVASLAVISSGQASGKTIPDNGNLIGVQPDGKIDGVEVPQMVYTFSESHWLAPAAITTAYKVTCASVVGSVNFGAAFKGFAAGEVLCTGISGTQRGLEQWQLRFAFGVLPNVSGLTVGPVSGIAKAGWDFIEWFSEEKENTTNKRMERELLGYRVHRVLRTGNFASLGIGT